MFVQTCFRNTLVLLKKSESLMQKPSRQLTIETQEQGVKYVPW